MTAPAVRSSAPAGPQAGSGRSWLSLPLALWRSPLTRNGYSLIASAGVTSVLGLVFWVVAARLYTAEQVGLSAALLSTLLTLGNISQLNFGNLLNRFLPVANKHQAARLTLVSYAVVTTMAALTSAGFLYGIGGFVKDLAYLRDSPLAVVGFITATVFWTVFALQDSVLAGLRHSALVPVENTIYALVKLGLLPLLVIFAAWLNAGIFAAWTLPLPLVVVVINLIIFQKFLPQHKVMDVGRQSLNRASMMKFFGWDYVGTLASMIALGVAPLLVMKTNGSAAIAVYHLAFTICYPLYLISRSMSVALLTESASDPARMPSLVADAIVHAMLPLVGGAAVVFIGAPWIMLLFGSAYVETGTWLVRLLVLSTIPWGLVTIYLAVARARGHMLSIAIVQTITLLIVVGLGAFLLDRIGELGIGFAWLAAHTAVALGILLVIMKRDGADRIAGFLFQIATTLGHLLANLRGRKANGPFPDGGEAMLARLCKSAGLAHASGWHPAGEIETFSDVRTFRVGNLETGDGETGDPLSTPMVILKVPVSEAGNQALEQALAAVRHLREQLEGTGCDAALPDVLAVERQAGTTWVLERLLTGEDGRRALADPYSHNGALAAALRAIDLIHRRTATGQVIGEDWQQRWVDDKLAMLGQTASVFMRPSSKQRAMDAFRLEQLAFWSGRSMPLGVGHGDFCPGNLLFGADEPPVDAGPAGRQPGGPNQLSAIVDWERMSRDAPPGLDAVHLAITVRMQASGAELGGVVRELLTAPRWTDDELTWLPEVVSAGEAYAGWPHDEDANRALAGLAWLHHVAANLEKSNRYASNRLWIAGNVERVLRAYLGRARQA